MFVENCQQLNDRQAKGRQGARGVSQGRIPVSIGKIMPKAPSSSDIPIKLTKPSGRLLAQGSDSLALAVKKVSVPGH
jgi:hypothetical protein